MAHETNVLLLLTTDQRWGAQASRILEQHAYRTNLAGTLAVAVSEIRRIRPALILVDESLIRKNSVCRDTFPIDTPVMVIRSFEGVCDSELCLSYLEAGFDVVFCSSSYRELIAHIRAILRRQRMQVEPSSQLRVVGLSMDISRHEVKVGNHLVDLTPKEFQILHQFLRAPGTVLSRQELLNRVWGEDYALEEHALDVHIHSLRQKIERDASKPNFIVTIRGIGYKLQQA